MTQYIEQYEPLATYNTTISTLKNMSIGGTLAVTGAITASGGVIGPSNVISGQGATVTLTAAQSGSLCINDRAAGIVWTLPAPVVGMSFSFLATVSVTSNSYKVITDAGTTLLIGTIESIDTDSTNAIAAWTGNGSTHIAVTQAAASTNATGGLQGSYVTFRCVSSTLWLVSGVTHAAGTPTTPFATS